MGETEVNFPPSRVPVYTAKDMLMHRWARGRSPGIKPPDIVIMTYQPSLINYAVKEFPVRKVGGFFGELYMLKPSGGKVAIAGNFGIGSPAAAVILEELAAFGVHQFVSIGLAGGLQPSSKPGSVILINAAFRDEGTSAHYSPPADIVYADPGIIQFLREAMEARDIPVQLGTSWTTDAPYRETWEKADNFRRGGMLTVEMEASAVFAVGQALKLQVGAAVVVADPLLRRSWNTFEEELLVNQTLQQVFNTIIAMYLQRTLV